MTDFTVRVRFRIPPGDRLGVDQNEETYLSNRGPNVLLKAYEPDQSIKKADWLLLKSEGWETQEDAESAAQELQDALRMALARFGMAADLGRRAARSAFFRHGLDIVSREAGRPALNDEHGWMVFPTDLKPVFANPGEIRAIRTIQADRWRKVFNYALRTKKILTDRERTASDLLAGAHAVHPSEDARFVLLFAALETLLEESPRSDATIQHVERLLSLTEDADLPEEEKGSLIGSLKWLRVHSIRRTGRTFVRRRLGQREYGGQSAESFFLDCYDLRNRLLHGNLPFPNRREVGALTGPLELMVGHLIAGPTLVVDV